MKAWIIRRLNRALDILDPLPPIEIEDLTDVSYRRIYHRTDFPGTLAISFNAYQRKHQDPRNCVTVGWVLLKNGAVLRVEGP